MPLSESDLEEIENRARERSAEYLNLYDPNGVLEVTQECQDVLDLIRGLRLFRKSRSNLTRRLNKAVSQLIAAGNLLMFLSDHLEGRMGEGALTEIELEGMNCFEACGAKYEGKLPQGAARS